MKQKNCFIEQIKQQEHSIKDEILTIKIINILVFFYLFLNQYEKGFEILNPQEFWWAILLCTQEFWNVYIKQMREKIMYTKRRKINLKNSNLQLL